MRWLWFLAGVLVLCASPAFGKEPIRYTVEVGADASTPSLDVEIAFDGDQDGVSEVELPSKWAGSEGLQRHLSDLAVTNGTLIAGSDPVRRTIRHRPGARLVLRYRLLDAQAGPPTARTYEKARPVIEADWFYVHAEGAFAIPTGREAEPARFRWGRLPKGWRAVSDLDVADPATLTANDAATAILVGGRALRVTERQVAGRPVLLAALGQWSFTDAQLADRLATLIATENAMLSEPAKPYVVSLMPLSGSEDGTIEYGGSGRTSGFALTSTDNVAIGDLTRLLAHEYAHRWFGQGFGPYADGAADYWFTEGFNDWFAGRAMIRSGLWTPADWRLSTNAMLLRYGSSTARGLTDAELSARFWTDPDAMQVQYDRGNLTATMLDADLKKRGGSLVAVFARMSSPTAPGEDEVSRLNRLAGSASVARARKGAADSLPANLFGACGTLQQVTQPSYDRGFTVTADTKVVDTVRRTGPAWVAGVRPGMRFVRRVLASPGDASKPYVAEFLDGSALRRISWLPEGESRVMFQQLARGDTDHISCLASLQ